MMREHCSLAIRTAIVGLVGVASWSGAAEAQQAAAAGQATNATQPPAGHSMHGEVFNEGPRQAAHLMGNTGNINLPVTSSVPQVQEFINQGIGQLHGFWYFESERSFRQAAALDPDCAMAYWGMAMANFENEKRAKGFAKRIRELLPNTTRREQLYLESLLHYFQASGADKKNRQRQFLSGIQIEFLQPHRAPFGTIAGDIAIRIGGGQQTQALRQGLFAGRAGRLAENLRPTDAGIG